ncbi:unnamed protein product [Adineta steineri]|nr:unnamed protein product [Adineta steineri]CAF4089414.1 unnamed protein product [Adineta steineri]
MVNTASSIVVQRSLSLSSEPPPLTITATSRDPVTSRPLVPSTTIKRKMAGGEALKEIKHLQSLVKSKDSEINKLTEQNKKLKLELETISKHSIFIPTNDAAIQWVDYVYESIHKHEIRDQLDLDNASSDLGIERESMELCLEIGSGDRISTARQLFKYCTDYDEVIRKEHSWKYIDNDIVVKICRFIREFFGVSLKHGDEYVCESLANMVRKDSWKIRNPEKAKTKSQRSSSTNNTTSLKSSEEIDDDNYHYTNSNDDDDDVAIN